ncbi:flagellar basal body rod protein FlgB [Legionella sp. W05-934-2]|jgi:flagellar basal-body rod protein FlgB|uniref:flagellar basal body rod protein FlgB n=1 Tax=Legionella sp. W05-934-2 TaxID=1198649 RepID=UPI003462C2B9
MGLDVNNWFGIHENALKIRDQRSSQIANNLANINTPNYKARDVDFKQMLQANMAGQMQGMTTDAPGHIQAQSTFAAELKYRTPSQTSLDGNSVDKDLEVSAFTQNALSYQASLSFLDGKIKSMIRAIRGE